MGQFELDLPVTQARTINLSTYDIYSQASMVGGLAGTTSNPLQFGIPQRGFEIGGYPNDGNFSWSFALVDGNNNNAATRNSKDIYLRVSQRFNLERDPNARKGVQAAGPTGPRDHTSIRFGAYYYYGRNALNPDRLTFPTLGTAREPFYRVGGDVRFKYRQFEIYGVGMYGHDTNLLPDLVNVRYNRGTPVTFSGGFVQAQYWIYPWLMPLLRFDSVVSPTDQQNGASRYDSRNRFSPGFQLLVRSNIKLAFEYQHRWQTSTGASTFYRPNGFNTGIDFVF